MAELLTRVYDFHGYFVLQVDPTAEEPTLTSRWIPDRHLVDCRKFKLKIVDTSFAGEDGVFIRTPRARMADFYLNALEQTDKRGYDFAVVPSKFEFENSDHVNIRQIINRIDEYKTKERWTRSLENNIVFWRKSVDNF